MEPYERIGIIPMSTRQMVTVNNNKSRIGIFLQHRVNERHADGPASDNQIICFKSFHHFHLHSGHYP